MLSIGIDDTDSSEGMCTTYLVFKLIQFLIKENATIVDYPLLIRLNPNIPWKTRGNGALCIRVKDIDEDRLFMHLKYLIDTYAHVGKRSNPAVVIFSAIDDEVREFSRKALYTLLKRSEGFRLAEKADRVYFKGNGQGLIGAIAAVGSVLNEHTYELLAYRYANNCKRKRILSKEDVIAMDKATYPYTFNNYDYNHNRILLTPHGKDPVFLGIRGEEPNILIRAIKMLKIEEELEGYTIFKSNQGTNAHLTNRIETLKPYTSGYIEGSIEELYAHKGGHTFFSINGIRCAVYEPTGLSAVAQRLVKGDIVRVGGGIRKASKNHPRVLNVEYIQVLKLTDIKLTLNPICSCGKRLKSAGRNKGYKCESCDFKGFKEREEVIVKREDIDERLYIPTPKAHRHLTKPLQRYGLKSKDYPLIDGWYVSNHVKVAGGGFSA